MLNDMNVQKRKQNMKIYSIYRAISMDILFFYAIDFLFLTQVKNISPADVVLKLSFFALFMIILQIPANILIDKIGARKCTILGNFFNAIYLLIILFATNFRELVIAEFFSALCFSIKDISDTTLLNMSIPESEKRGEIFSKIEGRGSKNYYYLNAITLVLAGVLYTINPYIPVILAIIIAIIATILSLGFQEIEITSNSISDVENKTTTLKEYVNDFKNSFKFIIKSNRLRSLIIYSGIMWGIFCLISTYRTSLLDNIGISATWISVISAIVGIASGIGSKRQLKIHNRFKNKTLSVLAITTAMMIWLSGIMGNANISPTIIMVLITIFYIIINMSMGSYLVLMTRYLSNFTTPSILPKIYSINAISKNVFRMLIGFVGSYILSITNTANSLILTGIMFSIITLALISYMKTRTGLKPDEYKKEDIYFEE